MGSTLSIGTVFALALALAIVLVPAFIYAISQWKKHETSIGDGSSGSVRFATYGDDRFSQSRRRIANEARDTGFFDAVTVYTPETLTPEFKWRFQRVLDMKRGGGYWIWKFDVLRQEMDRMGATRSSRTPAGSAKILPRFAPAPS
jgi:hypothetical protein